MSGNAVTQARRVQALDLRLAGASYRQIAFALGVGVKTAWQDVNRALQEYLTEPVEQIRAAEIARLDRLLMAYWQKALGGDESAAYLFLAIMDRRARLLGLDAPKRIDVTGWVRELAESEGWDVAQTVRDAEHIVKLAGL